MKTPFWIGFAIVIVLLLVISYLDYVVPGSEYVTPTVSNTQAQAALLNLELQYRENNPEIKGIVVEFSDFECPFCAQLDLTGVRENPDIGLVYLHYPLVQIHPFAYEAAVASECAKQAGVFWEYHDLLFDNQHMLNRQGLLELAGFIGLDATEFGNCIRQGNDQVDADISLGRSLGVQGTPTFFVVANQRMEMIEGVVSQAQLIATVERLHKI